MKLSVLIPSYSRPDTLEKCLVHLSTQSCDAVFEILVGLDGPSERTPEPRVPETIRHLTRIIRFPKIGYISIRRALLEQARGEIILSLNDDSYVSAGLFESHLSHHGSGEPCVVSGASSWKPIDSPDLFDLFVQRSDLVFFQQTAQRAERITSRNCFGLNMSFPRQLAAEVGGYPELHDCYGYDDIELAYRLERAGAKLWFAPRAVVVHDHRYRPLDVLRREYLLGRSAWAYGHASPAFAIDLFRRDIRSPEVLEYFRLALVYEYRDAIRVEGSFLALDGVPPEGFDWSDPRIRSVLEAHWILLKRYLWRWGVLDAAHSCEPRWSLINAFSPGSIGVHSCAQ